MFERIRCFLTLIDPRYEDLRLGGWSYALRDLSAGLVVALTAIPMTMGFAIASGLRPEQGIIAGVVACWLGAMFGGSKYQVYGPTAAFIPVVAGLMAVYGEAGGGSFEQGHAFLVLTSMVAGAGLVLMGLFGWGRYARWVPDSIVVGFTIGIAIVIALSNLGEALGLRLSLQSGLIGKVHEIAVQRASINWYAFGLALITFALSKGLLRVSVFIPAPVIAMAVATLLANTLFADKGIVTIEQRFGEIPSHAYFRFTPPALPNTTLVVCWHLVYFSAAILFVSAVESLLCSSMADRLAQNRGTPFHSDKELSAQGIVQLIVPLLNGLPCTGALARTATNIKAGATSPLAGYFMALIKLGLACYLAAHLDDVPMACIGGILLWVATNMIKVHEIREVWGYGRFHAALMLFTAVMVPLTDFLTGVLAALIVFAVVNPLLSHRLRMVESESVVNASAPPAANQESSANSA